MESLTISTGELSPAFDPATFAYTASVPHTTEHITVTATTEGTATFGFNLPDADPDTDGHQIALNVRPTVPGESEVVIQGTMLHTYTVTISRAAPPATAARLSSLTVTPGEMSPAFDTSTSFYDVEVGSDTTMVTVDATSTASNVTVTYYTSDHVCTPVECQGASMANNAIVMHDAPDADTTTDGHQVNLGAAGSDDPTNLVIRVISIFTTETHSEMGIRYYYLTFTRADP